MVWDLQVEEIFFLSDCGGFGSYMKMRDLLTRTAMDNGNREAVQSLKWVVLLELSNGIAIRVWIIFGR